MDLLLILPHPDDEVFGAGGTLIEYAERGLKTGLITLTRGDRGRTLGLCAQEELPQVREAELRRSAERLGIRHLEVHGYPDRGVAEHPEIVDLVVDRLRALKPRAVLTFPPNGINGHPDHVATSRWVTQAVQQSGLEPRLYYYAPPEPYPGHEAGHLPPTHTRRLPPEVLVRKLNAMAQHKTQALSVLNFMDRFPHRLALETFHLVGYAGPEQHELV